jgi:SAM-dependent methyltransferase
MRTKSQVLDALLRHQATISFGIELPLFRSPLWEQASTVLDFGCGNGEYLVLLADMFPRKHFTALDTDAELLGIATQSNSRPNIEYLLGSLAQLPDDFVCDVFLARLAMMYVADRAATASWARTHCTMGAWLIDTYDELFRVMPELPLFADALTGIRNRTDEVGGKRDLSVETRELWEGAGFRLLQSQPIIVHSDLPPGKTYMHHLMVLHAELAVGMPLDPELLEEIFAWSLDPNSYLQYGLLGNVFVKANEE